MEMLERIIETLNIIERFLEDAISVYEREKSEIKHLELGQKLDPLQRFLPELKNVIEDLSKMQ
ncbi:MAG: hypothetical protein A3I88_00705 [Candidatus Portnoybacteria bacterium RIFCSPLOWO2_12_FULL_39_9]|uniref:Uncharacterized protein n=1 Tax=Candidatus Portnoybacteria bacterium RIFCSPHIGHO2_12_FULL_38_9 TaxID=1801997 RepID=A0A1G2FEQ6_9BACT|nr:MAG: hypothetical protein A2646_01115 [Candidatus Portnoybacteria bacterium RIFCSPHIGHO2_02_FULL_39_12]OGZ36282.1 MAG: hypothetical protein A3J64_02955 [Candidatus Portnoybacteria bacterium RIFCSPHIGHO2_12_FULL_38_9]OGZ39403.1 MAG: hypothetical protein A3F21_03365 [Candidatus Portnoybacteria bacterium RIFCSPLOWO2_01_FULL_38_39]OGZ40746.1 MAG: hypothetical protein A3I88_00705 [Candidatus Portnoybacteria bacterium RIFCSPLOWO2_12_FULL_39_9]